MRYKMTSKIFTMVLSVMLTVTMMPISVFAEAGIDTAADPQMQTQESDITDAEDTGDTGPEASNDAGDTGDKAKETTDSVQAEGPDGGDEGEATVPGTSDHAGSFEMSEKMDDVIVSVRADKGVFPEDAVLSVKKLSKKEQKKVDAAVEDEMSEDKNVALSYTFDIKILDADGREIQPAEGRNAEVSFETVYASNPNIEAELYHITESSKEKGTDISDADGSKDSELTVERLDAETDEKNEIIVAETEGFSFYTVLFTYGSREFEFTPNDIDDAVDLRYILEGVQLELNENDITEVTSSNTDLIEPFFNDTIGIRRVRVKQFFDSTEMLYVTADGITYEIEASCEQFGDTVEYIDANGRTKECHSFQRIRTMHDNVMSAGWYVIDQNVKIEERAVITAGDVHLIICDGVKAEYLQGISVPERGSLTIYGQKDQSGEIICQPEPQFKLHGEEIEMQHAGIGGDNDLGDKKCGDITINGGIITAGGGMHHDAAIGGADGQANGNITINNGTVYAKVEYAGHKGQGFPEQVYAAAIGTGGGWSDTLKATPGDITINRGRVTAIAGGDAWGAAIGGGYRIKGPKITINGGIVKAIGASGAGIGGGYYASNEDVTINNGIVYALSYGKGAGIGGGNEGRGGKVTINDGLVLAMGGGLKKSYLESLDFYSIKQNLPNPALPVYSPGEAGKYGAILAALIAPLFEKGQWGGAGIGGGDSAAGGTVIINGGVVTATAGMNSAQAIGHGDDGGGVASITLYDTAKVTYGKMTDSGVQELGVEHHGDPDLRADRCRNNAYAKIEPGSCTIHFDVQGHGEAPSDRTVTGGDPVDKPDDPAAEGYLFDGWYIDEECTESYNFNLPVYVTSMTLYARWLKSCDLKVSKIWPDGAELPESLEFHYSLQKTRDKFTSGSFTVSPQDNWSGTLNITEESELEIREDTNDGFINGGWVLSGHDAEGNAVSIRLPVGDFSWAKLDLASKEDSGLSGEDYEKALEAVRNGSAELTLTNLKSKAFSVQKNWDDGGNYLYRPDVLKTVLQRKQSDGSWKTIATAELSQDNDWKENFDPVEDLGADNAAYYRIRELDKDDNLVPDKTDEDGDGEDPAVTLQKMVGTTLTDTKYKVTYDAMTDDGMVKITNKGGTVYSAEINWKDHNGDTDTSTPESVKVGLYTVNEDGGLTHRQTRVLDASNNWRAEFTPVIEADKHYVIREESSNEHIVFDQGEPLPVFYYEDENNKAKYIVTEDGKTNEYSYDVSYAANEDTKHTVITNKRTGIFFKVRKNWEFPEDSPWLDRVDWVYAVLQHKVKDESGNDTWETVGNREPLLGDKSSLKCTFPEVPLTDGFEAGDYRVREYVTHFTSYVQGSNYITYFDTEPPDVYGSGRHYKIMLAPDDEDNTSHEKPVFKAEYRVNYQTFEKTSFEVSYDRDENGYFIINNRQRGYLSAEKKWQDKDGNELDKFKPENVKAVLQHRNGDSWETVGEAEILSKENNWKVLFGTLINEDADMSAYRVRELDKDGKVIYDAGDSDAADGAGRNSAVFSVKDDSGENTDASFKVTYEDADDEGDFVIINKLNAFTLDIEKEWDIDLEKKDKPENIAVIIQKKVKGDGDKDKWEKVKIVSLASDDSYKASVILKKKKKKDNGEEETITYRVRELKEESAVAEFMNGLKDKIDAGQSEYTEWIGQFRESEYFEYLPDDIREAANTNYEALLEKLNATKDDLYDKLMEQLNVAYKPEQRIVYDKNDQEYKDLSEEDKQEPGNEANRVSYHVKEYESTLTGETEGAHVTRYMVDYKESDGGKKVKITNKAILEIDLIKRWIKLGAEDKDLPENVWVVLMFKPNPKAMEKAKDMGIDADELQDYEFPVFSVPDVIEILPDGGKNGGKNPVDIIGQLALGVDLSIFDSVIPLKMAMEKVSKDKENKDMDWRTSYEVSKYAYGIPLEFKGAELGSEIIRQIIKYLTGFDIPVSYNPLQNFISIPTKAIPTVGGITDPEDLIDFDKLTGVAKEKAQTITMDDINDFGWGSVLDMWRLMANVINIKIKTDSDDDNTDNDNTIKGSKIWEGDTEEKRPDRIKIHVKDQEGHDIEGSPVVLEKSDFEGKDEWTWEISLDEDADEDAEYTVSEEYPEGFENKDKYISEVNGCYITNIWHEDEPGKTTVSGRKIWDDDNDRDGIRPEKITVMLMADGQPVMNGDEERIAETSEAAGWRWTFSNLPEQDENGNEIEYSVSEVDVPEGYTCSPKEGSYDLINKHDPESIDIRVRKEWQGDDEDTRPESVTVHLKANGKEVDQKEISGDSWECTFEAQPKYRNNKEITYTVTEDKVTGYKTKIQGDASGGFTVVNTYVPGRIRINVNKVWNDENDKEGKRPGSVNVILVADGEDTDKKLTLARSNNWSGSFDDLDTIKGTDTVDYSVREEETEIIPTTGGDGKYKSEVAGSISEGFTVTNTYTPAPEEKITVDVTKTWTDEDNTDERPDKITFRLFANGVAAKDEQGNEITAEIPKDAGTDTQSCTFEDLPKSRNGKEISYTVSEDSVNNYQTTVDEVSHKDDGSISYKFNNKYTPGKTQVNVRKVWNDENDQDGKRPDSVTVRLLADNTATGKTLVLSENSSWEGSFTNLDMRKDGNDISYTVEEVHDSVITGYDGPGSYEDKVEGDAVEGFVIRNTHTPEKIKILVNKEWKHKTNPESERPTGVTVHLKADGKEVKTGTADEESSWVCRFINLPKYENGREITYTITEDEVENYITGISGDAYSGFTIVNTYKPDKTQVTVHKVWDDEDNRDGIRPASVTVKLLEDGSEVGAPVTLSAANNWMHTFSKLDKFNKNGKKITYTVEEEQTDMITGVSGRTTYAYNISRDREGSNNFTITNIHTHANEFIKIKVGKIWTDQNGRMDDNDQRIPDEIQIRLFADGNEAGSKTVTYDDDWKCEFTHLPKYDEKTGREIVYDIVEDPVEDFSTVIEGDAETGFIVTNKYDPGKTQVFVYKKWEDDFDADGLRPGSVTVELCKQGDEPDQIIGTGITRELNKGNDWSGVFEDLDAMAVRPGSDEKELIVYTVREVGTYEGYESHVIRSSNENTAGGIFFISNTHDRKITDIKVTKAWNDADDQDGKRPGSVLVRLFGNGEEYDNQVITAADEWEYTFEDVPVNENGMPVRYTVTEDTVTDYTYEVTGNAERGFTVTNSYIPGKTQVAVTNVWDDQLDNDRIRPKSIEVRLLEDGEYRGRKITLSEDNYWTGTFSELPAMKKGVKIKYTVTDDPVPGYESLETTGDQDTMYTLTKVHLPDTVPIAGKKTWDDEDDSDRIRPESITVHLYKDEEEVRSKTVTADDDWKWDFGKWQKIEAGREINYSVKEDPAEGYEASVKGFNITNRHEPETVDISGAKTWDDSNDAEGKRPQSITVHLMDGSNEVASRKVTAADGWKWTFNDIQKYRDGKEIRYSLLEDHVDGYTTAIDGMNVTNKYTPAEDDDDEKMFTITYDLNGGKYDGSKSDIVEKYPYGTVIDIHAAPTRKGFDFSYWKGSEYQPGDEYTVTEDHTFTAQWKESTGSDDPPDDPDKPRKETQTGDSNYIGLWLAFLMLSAGALASIVIYRRKRSE